MNIDAENFLRTRARMTNPNLSTTPRPTPRVETPAQAELAAVKAEFGAALLRIKADVLAAATRPRRRR